MNRSEYLIKRRAIQLLDESEIERETEREQQQTFGTKQQTNSTDQVFIDRFAADFIFKVFGVGYLFEKNERKKENWGQSK